MQYRRIGTSGLKTSALGLGNWLTYGTATEQEAARACVRTAYELGINHFDSANMYGAEPHDGERFLGEVLREYPRHSYILTTKAFWPVGPGPNDRGLSRKHLFDQIDMSLRALGTDYVDIFYCHRFDPETEVEETLRALDDLVRLGKIRYFGVSQWQGHEIADAAHLVRQLGLHKLIVNQPQYNMLQRGVEEAGIPVCQKEGIGLVVYSPLAQGLLTGKYKVGQPAPAGSRGADPKQGFRIHNLLTNPVLAGRLERVTQVAEDAGIPLGRLALTWLLQRPMVAAALVGATRPEQVRENVQAVELPLSPDLLTAIDQALA